MQATPRSTVAASAPPTAGETFAAAARLLAARGAAALPTVLELVARALPAVTVLVVRRGPAGEVIAAVPDRPGPPPTRRGSDDVASLDVPVRVRAATWAVLTAVAVVPFTAADALLLTAVADLVALALAADPAYAVADAAAAVLDVEADRAEIAAELGDRLGETLVALQHMPAERVGTAISAAQAAVRDLSRELRATSLHGGLRQALVELRATGAVVHARDPALDLVAPAIAVLVERVAELACRSAVGATEVAATVVADTVKLRVSSADNASDASELERWARRARALGGDLQRRPGGVELVVPLFGDDEGRHDDGPDL